MGASIKSLIALWGCPDGWGLYVSCHKRFAESAHKITTNRIAIKSLGTGLKNVINL